MNGGVKTLLVAASFAAAGCAAAPNGVEIRPIADPGSKLRAGAPGLADARGQLALGNVGLALEGYRKVARDYPDSAEAYAGMAACYEAMGRFDLAETKYEAALALAPRNPALLGALAGVLDRLGRADAATEIRGEIAQLNSAAAALDDTPADDAPVAQPAHTVTVALPAPQRAPRADVALPAADRAAELRPTTLAARDIAISAEPPASADQVTAKLPAPWVADRAGVNLRSGPLLVQAGRLDQHVLLNADLSPNLRGPRLGDRASVNFRAAPLEVRGRSLDQQLLLVADLSPNLPAPRLADRASVSVRATPLAVRGASLAGQARLNADLSPDIPAPLLGQRTAVGLRTERAPRLERLSLGEVALLTGSGPVWRGQVVARTPQKLTVRWVPLTTAAARPNIRLLNAARWQGLAARTRDYLFDRGWRKMEIGDAPQMRGQSLVLYPARHQAIGRRLAAQFGCRAQAVPNGNVFLVLLGRDWRLRPAQQRG